MTAVDETARNEQAELRLIEEAMNKRNAAVIDELVDPSCVIHALWHEAFVPSSMEGKSPIEMMKDYCEHGDPNFSDAHVSVQQVVSAGDKVVTVVTTTGSRGGKSISWNSVFIDRFENGKVVEGWSMYDRFGMYNQLGLVPDSRTIWESAGLK